MAVVKVNVGEIDISDGRVGVEAYGFIGQLLRLVQTVGLRMAEDKAGDDPDVSRRLKQCVVNSSIALSSSSRNR
jgi:hypothetical protein